MLGHLVPQGGGDPIPLLKPNLYVGRAEGNDIVLRFPNVSSRHCQLVCTDGYWYVTDLDSSNGTKVNGSRVLRKRLDPNDKLHVAKHVYEIVYSPVDNGAIGPPPPEEDIVTQIMNASLLQRAGLSRRDDQAASRRIDPRANQPGIMRRPKPTDD